MAVYFKFKSAKDFDSVSIDGHFISVATLKEKLVELGKVGRGSGYDLMISNAQTSEEYTDEGFLVPKNTSVIVRRVPGRSSVPIVADVRDERKSSSEVPLPVTSAYQKIESAQNTSFTSDGLDDFGIDLYAVPEVVPAPTTSLTEDEDNRIKAFVDASANDWQRQTQEGNPGGKGYGNKGQGRGGPALRGAYGRGFEKRNPPHGYVCHRCGVTGHYIQHCPTNGDPTYDLKKVKPPTGIPKTMLVANPDGSYALPTGEVAVLRPNEAVFEREVDGLPSSSRAIVDIPPELCCPLCKGALKDAVLTSKCCFKSYCDECIRKEIIAKAKCVCGATNIMADSLLPNRTLRDAITRFLESQVSAATSSGNVGSRAQLPDMESAPYERPKVPSPAVSASLKEASSVMVESDGSDMQEPIAGGKESGGLKQANAPPGQNPKTDSDKRTRSQEELKVEPAHQGKDDDGSPESQLTKESVQVLANSKRPRPETQLMDQGPTLSEPVKGKKRPKGKRVNRQGDMPHSESMWGNGPNYSNPHMQAENGCMNCGSWEHPSWMCPMINGPGPSHQAPPSMQGPMFAPGYNAQMRGMMMHPPMGDGYMMPYHHNPVPYSAFAYPPYDFQFNGAIMPPQEPYFPPSEMMSQGPAPLQRDYVDPTLMSRDEFEARKAELRRRREREQRFGREQVKYPSSELDIGSSRLRGRVGSKVNGSAETQRAVSPDFPEERDVQTRPHRSERRLPSGVVRVEKDEVETENFQVASDDERIAVPDNNRMTAETHEKPRRSRYADEDSGSQEAHREVRSLGREDGSYSSKQNKERSLASYKASGDPGMLRSGHRRPAAGYDSGDDELRRNSSSQLRDELGPSSSPPRRALLRGRVSLPDGQIDVEDDVEGVITTSPGGERVRKVLKGRERPRGSVFERTNLPRRVIFEVFDERQSRGKKRRGRGAGSREHQVRDGSSDGGWQGSRKRRSVVEDL